MKKQQTGEAMLVMMVAMLAIVWLANGHMGMMGHGGAAHAEKSGSPEQQTKASPPPSPAPKESTKPQH